MRSLRAAMVMVAVGAIAWSARADLGDPLPGTDPQLFSDARTEFAAVEGVADGLGPVFNGNSCAACHLTAGTVVGGTNGQLETRFGAIHGKDFDPLTQFGGSLIQENGIGTTGLPNLSRCKNVSFDGETVPPPAKVVAKRRTTPLFGLGLVDATPDSTFIQLAADEHAADPSTAGIVSLVPNPDTGTSGVVGRFGWKAQNPTLHVFSGDAYLNEMGITNPSFPSESCPSGKCNLLTCNPVPTLNDDGTDVTLFTEFMTFLAPPPPLPPPAGGLDLFKSTGCAKCHTPQLSTPDDATLSAPLRNQTYHPYSDFLLHDMGTLGDGITQNQATGTLMRTAPLWGIRFEQSLLHDGRVTNITDAILQHNGQGAAARDAFRALSAQQQNLLLALVGSL